MFKRKVYKDLLKWKKEYCPRYACLLEGARRVGSSTNRKLMQDFRIYMAVGGMPQAVDTYIRENNFEKVDKVKRDIISLYMDDLEKIDDSGRLSNIYRAIPAQLALDKKRFVVTAATSKQKTSKDDERIFELIDSKMVLPCYRVSNLSVSLSQTMEIDNFKLYISDIGLFTTMLFNDSEHGRVDIYKKLLGDNLPADLGYMYENVVAQILVSKGRSLFYHTWDKDNSTHYFEIDFLLAEDSKLTALEVKSSSVRNHKSIDAFKEKYGKKVGKRYLFSQKDLSNRESLMLRPVYMLPFMW